MHWLRAALREIENGGAPMAELDARRLVAPHGAGVRPAMEKHRRHRLDGARRATRSECAGYPAHAIVLARFDIIDPRPR